MKVLLLAMLFHCPANLTPQDWPDVVMRPTGPAAAWTVLMADHGDVAEKACIFRVGTDHTIPANWVDCRAAGALGIVVRGGFTTSPQGTGDEVFRAIAVGYDGMVSEPSANTRTVVDIPWPIRLSRPRVDDGSSEP